MPPERRVTLAGAENFRDLGGYATADGRRVRWGRLYRSGHLGDLTTADVARVERLDLRTIVDLRTPAERAAAGSRLPASSRTHVLELPVDFPPLDPDTMRRRLLGGDVRPGELEDLLLAANRAYVTELAAPFGRLLPTLATPDGLPALIHCNGGKDRTGFAAALVLRVLGVPPATIVDDYLLTNAYTARTTRRRTLLVWLASRCAVHPREMRALLEARPAYLEGAFAAMRTTCGSEDAFFRDVLGLDDATRDRLRATLLD